MTEEESNVLEQLHSQVESLRLHAKRDISLSPSEISSMVENIVSEYEVLRDKLILLENKKGWRPPPSV